VAGQPDKRKRKVFFLKLFLSLYILYCISVCVTLSDIDYVDCVIVRHIFTCSRIIYTDYCIVSLLDDLCSQSDDIW
jgi:hypothetical protein